jgi:hypothetical protein
LGGCLADVIERNHSHIRDHQELLHIPELLEKLGAIRLPVRGGELLLVRGARVTREVRERGLRVEEREEVVVRVGDVSGPAGHAREHVGLPEVLAPLRDVEHLHLDLHSQVLLEHGRDNLGREPRSESAGVRAQHERRETLPAREAGLRQQGLGARGVERDHKQRAGVPGEAGRKDAARRLVQSLERGPRHLRPVDRVRHRLAHPDVLEGRVGLLVQHQEHRGRAVDLRELLAELRIGLEASVVARRHLDDVELAGLVLLDPHRRLWHDLEYHLADLGGAAEVARVGRQRDPLPEGPLGEAERAGTVRLRRAPVRAALLDRLPGHDPRGDVGEPHEEVPLRRTVHADLDLVRAQRLDAPQLGRLAPLRILVPLDRRKEQGRVRRVDLRVGEPIERVLTSAAVALRPA